jgi:hypothetical protein
VQSGNIFPVKKWLSRKLMGKGQEPEYKKQEFLHFIKTI